MRPTRVHDRAILDALEAVGAEAFAGDVWRVTRKGLDPLRGSTARGRWSPPGEFEVLYTGLEKAGALAEIGYRLSIEPVWPSRLEHTIHRVSTKTERTLKLADLESLMKLGVDPAKYQSFEYSVTQAIAAAAYFLEFDGLKVPSARFDCRNLVIFLDRLSQECRLDVQASEPVNWNAWRRAQSKR